MGYPTMDDRARHFSDIERSDSDYSSDEEQGSCRLPKLLAGAALLAASILAGFAVWRGAFAHGAGEKEPRNGELFRSPEIPQEEVNLGAEWSTTNPTPLPIDWQASLEEPTPDPLNPDEDLYDGNVCQHNEELHVGLCYKKCSLLTTGTHPIRTSPWSCCSSRPCLLNQKGSIGTKILCNGYDIGGNGGCPHKPGACLKDEEMFLGFCYKKCSLLTDNEFPYRKAAATCCKDNSWGCMDPRKDRTRPDFAVGGGEHSLAHPPSKSLTEAADSEAVEPALKAAEEAAPQRALEDEEAARPMEPGEDLHDGNLCKAEEENYGGLCYRTCSSLTGGTHPIRSSSWTCCRSEPCHPFNQKGSMGYTVLCNGYDVGADGKCPHKPGACFSNEEMHLGVCYKKCSILTQNKYPHRIAAATCCKSDGLTCFNIFQETKTRPGFAVGGGAGFENSTAPSGPHPPRVELTEDKDAQTNPEWGDQLMRLK